MNIATVREIEATAIARSAGRGQQHHNAAIYVSIEEEGFGVGDLIYCRYGLGIPFYKVQVGEQVLVEPTNGNDERWFYTGLVDATETSPTESYVLGDAQRTQLQKDIDALTQLQTDFNAWTPVPMDGGAALKTLLASGFLTKTLADLTNTLSQLIKGK